MASDARPRRESNYGDLLRALQENNNRTKGQLAKELGTTSQWMTGKEERLHVSGHIKNSRAILEPLKLDLRFLGFIAIKLKDQDPVRSRATAAHICQFPNVQEVHHVTGEFDMLVKLRGRDLSDHRRFLEHLSQEGNFGRVETMPVTGTVLETTEFLISHEEAARIDHEIRKFQEETVVRV